MLAVDFGEFIDEDYNLEPYVNPLIQSSVILAEGVGVMYFCFLLALAVSGWTSAEFN